MSLMVDRRETEKEPPMAVLAGNRRDVLLWRPVEFYRVLHFVLILLDEMKLYLLGNVEPWELSESEYELWEQYMMNSVLPLLPGVSLVVLEYTVFKVLTLGTDPTFGLQWQRLDAMASYMLDKMATHNRYKAVVKELGQHGAQTLVSFLKPGFRGLYNRSGLTDVYGLMNLGSDSEYTDIGIYVHLVFVLATIRYYIGQSINLCRRLKQHNSPWHRALPHNWSLHYTAVDFAQDDCLVNVLQSRDKVAELSAHLNLDDKQEKLVLNLLEMLVALCFKSLPHSTLKKFLPAGEDLGPQIHLNVASPVDQGTKATKASGTLLENSDDWVHQAWYLKRATRAVQVQKEKEDPRLQYFRGVPGDFPWQNTKADTKQYTKKLRGCRIQMSSSCVLNADVDINIVVELEPAGKEHPYFWARFAKPDDPARRVGIRLEGVHKVHGFPCHTWTRSAGAAAIFQGNSLVDFLDGEDWVDFISKDRRFVEANNHYTSELDVIPKGADPGPEPPEYVLSS